MAMHDIKLDGAERRICRNCVDDLRMGGKPEKLNKLGHRTVYRREESEEDKEELEGTWLGDGGEEVSIVSVVYTRGTVSISSLGSLSSVGSSSKHYHPCFPISLIALHIQEYFKKKRGMKKIH